MHNVSTSDPLTTYDSWKVKKPMCMILESYISDKFSASIRTEKEIGYVATSNIFNVNESNNPDLFLLFIVQSTRTDLEDIVKDYVDNHMLKDVESMTNDEFESIKQSIIITMGEKPINIYSDCAEKMSALIDTYENISEIKNINVRFLRNKIMINAIKKVNKHVFVDFVKQILKNNIRSVFINNP